MIVTLDIIPKESCDRTFSFEIIKVKYNNNSNTLNIKLVFYRRQNLSDDINNLSLYILLRISQNFINSIINNFIRKAYNHEKTHNDIWVYANKPYLKNTATSSEHQLLNELYTLCKNISYEQPGLYYLSNNNFWQNIIIKSVKKRWIKNISYKTLEEENKYLKNFLSNYHKHTDDNFTISSLAFWHQTIVLLLSDNEIKKYYKIELRKEKQFLMLLLIIKNFAYNYNCSQFKSLDSKVKQLKYDNNEGLYEYITLCFKKNTIDEKNTINNSIATLKEIVKFISKKDFIEAFDSNPKKLPYKYFHTLANIINAEIFFLESFKEFLSQQHINILFSKILKPIHEIINQITHIYDFLAIEKLNLRLFILTQENHNIIHLIPKIKLKLFLYNELWAIQCKYCIDLLNSDNISVEMISSTELKVRKINFTDQDIQEKSLLQLSDRNHYKEIIENIIRKQPKYNTVSLEENDYDLLIKIIKEKYIFDRSSHPFVQKDNGYREWKPRFNHVLKKENIKPVYDYEVYKWIFLDTFERSKLFEKLYIKEETFTKNSTRIFNTLCNKNFTLKEFINSLKELIVDSTHGASDDSIKHVKHNTIQLFFHKLLNDFSLKKGRTHTIIQLSKNPIINKSLPSTQFSHTTRKNLHLRELNFKDRNNYYVMKTFFNSVSALRKDQVNVVFLSCIFIAIIPATISIIGKILLGILILLYIIRTLCISQSHINLPIQQKDLPNEELNLPTLIDELQIDNFNSMSKTVRN